MAARTLAALNVGRTGPVIAMAIGAVGVTGVIKVYIMPIISEMAVGALAGPVTGGRQVAGFAIGIAGMVKNNIVPTIAGHVAGCTGARVVVTGGGMANLAIPHAVVVKVNIVPPGRRVAI
jgi:hypothetical protein